MMNLDLPNQTNSEDDDGIPQLQKRVDRVIAELERELDGVDPVNLPKDATPEWLHRVLKVTRAGEEVEAQARFASWYDEYHKRRLGII